MQLTTAMRCHARSVACAALAATLLVGGWVQAKPGRYKQSSPAATAAKFRRVSHFAATGVVQLRQHVRGNLARPKLDRQTAVAAIVRIMDTTYMRVGSERYATPKAAGKKPSFGASSLRKEHVRVQGNRVSFAFRGKSGKAWNKSVVDPQLAAAIEVFLAQPGERLFQVPGRRRGSLSAVTERDVRGLLKRFGAQPKDFRTLHANRLLEAELTAKAPPKSRAQAERNLSAAIRRVASQLNHTTSVCRSNYLDQTRLRSYTTGLK